MEQTIEVAVTAIVGKTPSRPPPRAPSLARAPWQGTTNAGDVFCHASFVFAESMLYPVAQKGQ